MKVNKVGIIGSGTMGIGIAQVSSTAGCDVCIFDQNSTQVIQAISALEKTLSRLVEKQKITQDIAQAILSRIRPVDSLVELSGSDLIIEAIVENRDIKKKLFAELEEYISEDCILASNTSSISITSLSAGLKNPERFIGLHFFNPAPLMPLVEVIPSLLTRSDLAKEMVNEMKSWQKEPIIASDVPGFIVNRIARPFYGEGLRIVEEGLATPAQVDEAMKLLGNFRMGPFELMDLIGVEVNFSVTQTVYSEYFGDPKYRPSLLQQRMAEAGLHGRKTGRGFYHYGENAQNPKPEKNEKLYQMIFERVLAMLINEAVEALRLKIATESDIELAMQKGVNYPKGLLQWGREIGFGNISKILQNLYEKYQEDRYRQSPLLKNMI